MLLYYFETMNPKKVCATAKYLGLKLDYVKLDPSRGEHKSPEHLARNPNGRVPVLIDGDTTLWESAAIMAHLSLKAESDLFPVREPARLVEVLRWLSWDASHFAPHGGAIYFEKMVKPRYFGQSPDLSVVETKLPLYRRALEVLEAHLVGRSYLVGEQLSIADFCLGVLFALADEIQLPLADAPNVRRWHDGLMQLEAWRNPWPS
jgi:glutathione S-transferase